MLSRWTRTARMNYTVPAVFYGKIIIIVERKGNRTPIRAQPLRIRKRLSYLMCSSLKYQKIGPSSPIESLFGKLRTGSWRIIGLCDWSRPRFHIAFMIPEFRFFSRFGCKQIRIAPVVSVRTSYFPIYNFFRRGRKRTQTKELWEREKKKKKKFWYNSTKIERRNPKILLLAKKNITSTVARRLSSSSLFLPIVTVFVEKTVRRFALLP